MKIAIATVQVPFIRGGAEVLAESLRRELLQRGYDAEIVSIPFKWYPGQSLLNCMLAGRSMDVREVNGERIDMVIGLKFPAYFTRHDSKVVWLLHQHRQAYDLWGTPYGDLHTWPEGERIRQIIHEHDRRYLAEAKRRFTIADNVTGRLARYCGLDAVTLYHPPNGWENLHCEDYQPFLFYPSRLDNMKRQRLLIEAARHLRSELRVVIAGRGSQSETDLLQAMVREYGLESRVTLAGPVSEADKMTYYANCRCVFFGGYDEDYGYVPLEGLYSRKPVIVLEDTGGGREFIEHGKNGYIVENDPQKLAQAMDGLGFEQPLAEQLGGAGLQSVRQKNVSWDHVIKSLVEAGRG